MRDHSALGPWIRRFLLEHLTGERNLAKNTQYSYRDTMALSRRLLPRSQRCRSTGCESKISLGTPSVPS